eukprot:SAG11_NODE_8980_length_956_cov_4.185531_1_plen_68_part_10
MKSILRVLPINGIVHIDLRKGSRFTAGQILDSYMYHGTSIIVIYTEFSTTGSWYLLDVLGCTFASFIK